MYAKKTSFEYEIVPYSERYFKEWKKFFEKPPQTNKYEDYFIHNTKYNPSGKTIQYLMLHKGKVVGSHSICPIKFRIKDKIVLGGLTYDSLTDPDYQNMGIFTALALQTHGEAKKQNYQFVCGYANSQSIDIYQKELQHKKLKDINFIKITDFEKVKEPGSFVIGMNKIPSSIPTELLTNTQNQFTCAVVKDIPYLKWRYEQKHHGCYTVYSQHSEFLIFTKRYEQREQIVNFFVKDTDAFRRALTVVAHVANRDNIQDITMWIHANHPLLKEAAIKYETQVAKQFFHIISFNDDIEQYILNSDKWNHSMGDSDVY